MDDEQEGHTESALVTRYTYDSFNRLLCYSDHDGSTCYSYNADGYRTAKYDYDDSSDVTRYLTIGGRNLFETSCAGSFTALNTYGTTLTSRASLAGGYEYRNIVYLYSAYGDVVLVADAQTGMKFASYAYDPFGNAILAGTPDTSVEISESSGESSDITVTSGTESSASIDNPYGYRGYVKDDESGLYYLNARYYDSTSGRFLTADTFRGSKDDPLSLNRYVYCQSNPVRYTDPSGHSAAEFWDKICTVVDNGVNIVVTTVKDGYNDVKNFVIEKKDNLEQAGYSTFEIVCGGAVIAVGAGAIIVITGGTAAPAVITGLTYVAGGTAVALGTADVFEGAGGLYNAVTDKRDAYGNLRGSMNPVRDTIFANNPDDYYFIEALATAGAACGMSILYDYRRLPGSNQDILYYAHYDTSSINANGATESGIVTELFLPDEFYNKDLPSQVTPGIKYLPKFDEDGNVKQIKMYDDYGREIGWVDFTDHGYSNINSRHYHTVPHWHERIYNAIYRDGKKINHRTDTNTPLGDR